MTTIKQISVNGQFYSTNKAYIGNPYYADEIKGEETFIGKGLHNDLTLTIYTAYLDGKPIFQVNANNPELILMFDN